MNDNLQKLHEVCSEFLEIAKYCKDKKLENLMSQYEFEYNLVFSLKHDLLLLDDKLKNRKYHSILTEIKQLICIMPEETALYYLLDKYYKNFFALRNILLKDLESGVYDGH